MKAGIAGSLDTNVLLRLLLQDDKRQHALALELLNKTDGQFMIADAAIIELVFVLDRHYQFSRRQVGEVVGGLLGLPKLACNQAALEEALSLFTAQPKLSFEDCYLAVYARLASADPLWTFDKKLARQAPHTALVQ